ncbi:hypothetical protein GDO81_006235 [Engystomops pustulosus]|uniref:Uncharacterized protein n=1 Tax=Engystomops pustulosus TaxID=76066 RepID=A0AAV7CV96_ENGPU|nr:hypothetical protein GDO81_006235 [Engystomops pustulosus]
MPLCMCISPKKKRRLHSYRAVWRKQGGPFSGATQFKNKAYTNTVFIVKLRFLVKTINQNNPRPEEASNRLTQNPLSYKLFMYLLVYCFNKEF